MQIRLHNLARKLMGIWTDAKFRLSIPARDRKTIKSIRSEKLTYLSTRKLSALAKECKRIEKCGLEGVFIEAGCALGGSSILIARIKNPNRVLRVYDVFSVIPPPTEKDTSDVHDRYEQIAAGKAVGIAGDKYYGYEDDLLTRVKSNMRNFGITREDHNVFLIKGLVQDTLQADEPIALAHIDVDWYEPVITCLERVYPKLVVGGSIVLDDYHDWGGCRKAADDFFRSITGKYVLDDTAGSMKILKMSD